MRQEPHQSQTKGVIADVKELIDHLDEFIGAMIMNGYYRPDRPEDITEKRPEKYSPVAK